MAFPIIGVNIVMTHLNLNGSSRALPPVGEHVIVQCPKFSCLGYVDADGKWKNAYTNTELREVVEFYPIG